MNKEEKQWNKEESKIFSAYGDIFVPDRPVQYGVITQLLSSIPNLLQVVELGCGEGLLCEKVLEHFPEVKVKGMDLSPVMLEKTRKRLSVYEDRFTAQPFDLGDSAWRFQHANTGAFISSLAVHHLDDIQKKLLFKDLFGQLTANGMLILADIVRPQAAVGYKIAAEHWDEDVRTKTDSLHKPEAYKIFKEDGWNYFENPDADPIDKPSTLYDQLLWLREAGFKEVDVYWMKAGHAIFAGRKY
ncbi:class I SAM-dependent methyltransferase [Fulvivirgaceae bacterium BMA12]|uniref:Class I SAM-dependent methyltransferase n=1 Tax=Agaribacillus aureus TaxID=3051825 RepID=A0ABT8LHX0_9BACT|nr:class I SAM-dependent methyltransferase [Fulvivirgaceae bacterium BMA12]